MTWNEPGETAVVVNEVEELTDAQKAERRNARILAWMNAKSVFEVAQEAERKSRAELTTELFPVPVKGTQRADIGNGWNIKLVHGLKYTLGDKNKLADDGRKVPTYDQIMECIERIRDGIAPRDKSTMHRDPQMLAVAEDFIARLFKFSIELSGTEYEKLDGNMGLFIKGIVDEILTVTPATPQLTQEPPKPAK